MFRMDEEGGLELGETCFVDQKMNGRSCVTVKETTSKDTHYMKDIEKISGVKRARSTADEEKEQSSHVCVSYRLLPRESKRKLEELLYVWSECHAQHFSSFEGDDERLHSGLETYYPALLLGANKSSPVSFLLDVPLSKKLCKGLISFDKEYAPLYDREYTMPLYSNEYGSASDRGLRKQEDPRCFNCGSYDHSLQECSRPRDNNAISNARKKHQAKKKINGRPQVRTRYYQAPPSGKYDGLKPGSLSAETRQLLGVGELDPPPWHAKMKELGYPPAYLDVETKADEEPSGLTIFSGDESMEVRSTDPVTLKSLEAYKKQGVSFPGMNAPLPKNADPVKWGVLKPLGVDIPRKQLNCSQNYDMYSTRQTPDPHRADSRGFIDLRFSEGTRASPPLSRSCRASGDCRDRSFGISPPSPRSYLSDRDYRGSKFPRSSGVSPPILNSFHAERDSRDGRFSRSLEVRPCSPEYFSHRYSSHLTANRPKYILPPSHPYLDRALSDIWDHSHTSHDRALIHRHGDHSPFSFSPPDCNPVLGTRGHNHRHPLHNGYL